MVLLALGLDTGHGLVSRCAREMASKLACRSEVPAARRASPSRFYSGVLLPSPLRRRTNGLPMANGGLVARLCQSARFCAMSAHSV